MVIIEFDENTTGVECLPITDDDRLITGFDFHFERRKNPQYTTLLSIISGQTLLLKRFGYTYKVICRDVRQIDPEHFILSLVWVHRS